MIYIYIYICVYDKDFDKADSHKTEIRSDNHRTAHIASTGQPRRNNDA